MVCGKMRYADAENDSTKYGLHNLPSMKYFKVGKQVEQARCNG